MRPIPSAQTASICGSCLGSYESFAMLFLCQSNSLPSPRDRDDQAIFASASPTAIRDIRPFALRREQIPETSRSGTSTTRRTRSRFFFGLPFLAMEKVFPLVAFGACSHVASFFDRQFPLIQI